MCIAPGPTASPEELPGDLLILRGPTAPELSGIVGGERGADWAPDFPQPGDVDAIKLNPSAMETHDGETTFGARLVVVRGSGMVVGTAGFHGPPIQGEVEIGYGIVPSARRRGYATEAARLLAAFALEQPGVELVTAHTEEHNEGSQNILLSIGFMPVETDGPHLTFHYAGPQTDSSILEEILDGPAALAEPDPA